MKTLYAYRFYIRPKDLFEGKYTMSNYIINNFIYYLYRTMLYLQNSELYFLYVLF